MTRISIISICLALIVMGCDGDINAPATGSIVLQVVPRSQATFLSFHAHRGVAYNAGAAAAADTLEAARAHAIGPDSRTINLLDDGANFTGRFDGIDAGTYLVAVEGIVGGEVGYFGSNDAVLVRPDSITTAIVPFGSFRPRLHSLDSATTAFRLVVGFSSIADADSYTVEWDTNSSFTSTAYVTVDTTEALTAVSDTGKYYLQVWASNDIVDRGRASEPGSFEVVTDISATGDDQSSAAWLGFGTTATDTIGDVNIFPVGDEDWYSVDLCSGDSLNIEVLAARLMPSSMLNSLLGIHDSTGAEIVSNDDSMLTDARIESEVTAHGRYAIRVTAGDTSYGHYQLAVVVVAGPQNTGSSCQ